MGGKQIYGERGWVIEVAKGWWVLGGENKGDEEGIFMEYSVKSHIFVTVSIDRDLITSFYSL